jgi:hypothetical protein
LAGEATTPPIAARIKTLLVELRMVSLYRVVFHLHLRYHLLMYVHLLESSGSNAGFLAAAGDNDSSNPVKLPGYPLVTGPMTEPDKATFGENAGQRRKVRRQFVSLLLDKSTHHTIHRSVLDASCQCRIIKRLGNCPRISCGVMPRVGFLTVR